jgi:hypothetical protein
MTDNNDAPWKLEIEAQVQVPYGIEDKLDGCIQRKTTTKQHSNFNHF